MAWLRNLTIFLLLAYVQGDVEVQPTNIAEEKWIVGKDSFVGLDFFIIENRAVFSYATCSSTLGRKSCKISLQDIIFNAAISRKVCQLLLNSLEQHSVRLNILRNGRHAIVSYEDRVLRGDSLIPVVRINIVDMDSCTSNELTLEAKTHSIVAYENTFDVITCSGEQCLMTYDYKGARQGYIKPFQVNHQFSNTKIYPTVTNSPGEGYFVVHRDEKDGKKYIVSSLKPNSYFKTMNFFATSTFNVEGAYNTHEGKISLLWLESYPSWYRFLQLDRNVEVNVDSTFYVKPGFVVLAVYQLNDGHLLVWTVSKGNGYSLYKDYAVQKIHPNGKIVKTYTYYDSKSLFNVNSSPKTSAIYEFIDQFCLSNYYLVNAESEFQKEYKWDLKCIDKSVLN